MVDEKLATRTSYINSDSSEEDAVFLGHQSIDFVYEEVNKIIERYPDLEDKRDILISGALVANDPKIIDSEQYSDEDRVHYYKEKKSPLLAQPWQMFFVAIVASFAAVNFGMDESAVGGAQVQYAVEFNLTDPNILGVTNAAPYLAASILGCPLATWLDRYWGRKEVVFLSCIIGVAGSLWQAFSYKWSSLLVARLFLGVGMGLNSSTVPMMIAETSPASSRGTFLMLWQTFIAFGVMFGSVMNRAFVNVPGYTSWRLMIGSSVVAPFITGSLILFIPESPRWLLSASKGRKSFNSLQLLRRSPLLGARDFYILYESLSRENELDRLSYWNQFKLFFTDKRVRFAFWVASFGIFMQQYCGVNILVGYTTTILVNAGISSQTAIAGSIGIGGGCFLATFFSTQIIDRYGRRIMLLATFPILGACLFWLGGSLYISDSSSRLGSGLTSMYVFVIAYGLGIGPVSFTLNAESYPLNVRALGVSLSMSLNWILDFVLSMSWPKMADSMTVSGGLYFYGAWNFVAFVITFFLIPETKQLTLEELDKVFQSGAGKFAQKQLNRLLKRQKN